jgi:hypothetical protein
MPVSSSSFHELNSSDSRVEEEEEEEEEKEEEEEEEEKVTELGVCWCALR